MECFCSAWAAAVFGDFLGPRASTSYGNVLLRGDYGPPRRPSELPRSALNKNTASPCSKDEDDRPYPRGGVLMRGRPSGFSHHHAISPPLASEHCPAYFLVVGGASIILAWWRPSPTAAKDGFPCCLPRTNSIGCSSTGSLNACLAARGSLSLGCAVHGNGRDGMGRVATTAAS